MATFGELQTEIQQKVDESYLAPQIAAAINRTIEYLQVYPLWFNTNRVPITLNINDPIVPHIPLDFQYEINPGGLVINWSSMFYPLRRVHEIEYDLANIQVGQGRPGIYCFRDEQFEIYFYPDLAYTLYLYYVKKYDPLVNESDSNDWTNNARRLIVTQTLADLYMDQRKSTEFYDKYSEISEKELSRLKQRNKNSLATGELITHGCFTPNNPYNYYSYY